MNNRYRNYDNSRGYAPRGRASFSGRRIKTFDPTQFINSAKPNESTPEEVYTATNTFDALPILDILKLNIKNKGYKDMTPIQDQAIPHILENKDVIGIANTGTGKTAAFLIPLLNKVANNRAEKVLIVAPTRELAAQIREEFINFARGLSIFCTLCIGGANLGRQRSELYRNPNFVIGTPGRLKDLIKSGALNLSGFGSIVLDEADHMVDIGFINDIKFIVSQLNKKRLSLFFSATIDGRVKEVLREFVQNPVTVSVKKRDIVANIEQKIVRVPDLNKKVDLLDDLLAKEDFEKVLVFGRTKRGVQKLSDELRTRGFRSDSIHGNKNQSQRLRVLENFKRNNIHILIATDVAARGLDIPNVSHVINYDMPESQDTYTHRIGRTGRAGKRGIALTFIG
jgi:ATP-dependent RNA helicase RhlE